MKFIPIGFITPSGDPHPSVCIRYIALQRFHWPSLDRPGGEDIDALLESPETGLNGDGPPGIRTELGGGLIRTFSDPGGFRCLLS